MEFLHHSIIYLNYLKQVICSTKSLIEHKHQGIRKRIPLHMKVSKMIFVTLAIITTLSSKGQDCSSCDSYLSGTSTGNITVPAGQTYCINNVAFTNFHILTINGTLRTCGSSTDFQSVNTITVGPDGAIDIRDCPTRVAFSGFKTSNSSNPLVYDCSLGSCSTNGSNTVWNGGSGSTINQCNTVLPITLHSFIGKKTSNGISLKWVTLNEKNNDFFTIERSVDAINFEPIKVIDGAGTSFDIHSYSHLDITPKSNTNYYRLKQTDHNREYSYSKTIAIVNKTELKTLSFYPNPAKDKIHISHPFNEIHSIVIQNLEGESLLYEVISSKEDVTSIVLNISNIPGGYYIIKIHAENKVEVFPLVISR